MTGKMTNHISSKWVAIAMHDQVYSMTCLARCEELDRKKKKRRSLFAMETASNTNDEDIVAIPAVFKIHF